MTALTEHQVAMLDLERAWFRRPGSKEQAILQTFGISPTRYYQQLNALIDTEVALAHDPITVNRLRRQREARRIA